MMCGVTPIARQTSKLNREKIVAAALQVFARDPDAAISDVAEAAGVVRRTVYGHFANRRELVEGIADQASKDLVAALSAIPNPSGRPDLALALLTLGTWPVADRYGTLLGVGRQELGEPRILELLAPARQPTHEIVAAGQAKGVFSAYIAVATVVALTEAATLTLLEQANEGLVADPCTDLAVISLVIAGIDPDTSTTIVAEARTMHAPDKH